MASPSRAGMRPWFKTDAEHNPISAINEYCDFCNKQNPACKRHHPTRGRGSTALLVGTPKWPRVNHCRGAPQWLRLEISPLHAQLWLLLVIDEQEKLHVRFLVLYDHQCKATQRPQSRHQTHTALHCWGISHQKHQIQEYPPPSTGERA